MMDAELYDTSFSPDEWELLTAAVDAAVVHSRLLSVYACNPQEKTELRRKADALKEISMKLLVIKNGLR